MALAMARESRLPANESGARPGTVYASEQAHMSIPKAVALLGIGRDNLRLIPCDENFRMRLDELGKAIAKDVAAGLTPIAIVGSAGTVSTGSIDPLPELGDHRARVRRVVSHRRRLRCAGVYRRAGEVRRTQPGRLALARSAQVALSAGGLRLPALSRSQRPRSSAFSHTGDYAKSLLEDPVESFAFFEESMELSRRFRALKLWLSLRYHGMEKFREAIRKICRTRNAWPSLSAISRSWKCWRRFRSARFVSAMLQSQIPASILMQLNQAILQRIVRRGKVFLSNASIQGKFALRACFVNHRTTPDDVAQIVSESHHGGQGTGKRGRIVGCNPFRSSHRRWARRRSSPRRRAAPIWPAAPSISGRSTCFIPERSA